MDTGSEAFCAPFTRAVELIGKRWTGAVLYAVLAGRARFSEIARSVPGLSDRLLSERLKELEQEGMVIRTVRPTTPVQVTYEATDKGRDLLPIIRSLEAWAQDWAGR
jgi:DNA-binding HxlR family transcriptional regulator